MFETLDLFDTESLLGRIPRPGAALNALSELHVQQQLSAIPLLSWRLATPLAPAVLVERPDLMAALDKGVERQVVVISAPAGFGKTTTVAAWLAQRSTAQDPTPVAWYTVDRADSNLRIFCAYLLAALRTLHPEVGKHTQQTLLSARLPSPDQLADLLIEELTTLKGETVLVVDDYHGINDPAVHSFFGRLLNHLPRGIHFILLTRNSPAFSLARLRSRSQLTWLRAEQLRFNLSDAKKLLALNLGSEINDETAAAIYQQVQGWSAALVLFSAAIRERVALPEAGQGVANSGSSYIFDYLMAEVLAGQPPEIEEFLLRTSILDRLCADLCAAVLPACAPERARELLSQLEQTGLLLVIPDGTQSWYHYHSLLQQVLRQRMQQLLPQEAVQASYRRAAGWMAQAGDVEQAINYYLAADAAPQAAALVESALADLQNREQWILLNRWLQRLPTVLLEERPALLMAQAWVAYSRLQYQRLDTLINKAAALLAEGKGPDALEEASALLGEIEAFYASPLLPDRVPEQRIRHGQRALELLPAERTFARGFAVQNMADAYRATGQWQEAVQLLRNALHSVGSQAQPYAVRLLHGLTVTYGYTGQLQNASRVAQIYHYYAEQANLPMSMAWGHALMGLVASQQNQIEAARIHFKQVLEMRYTVHPLALFASLQDLILLADTEREEQWLENELAHLRTQILNAGDYEALFSVDALEALLWLRQGNLPGAWGWAQTVEPGKRLTGGIPLVETTYIRCMLAEGTAPSLGQARSVAEYLEALCRRAHIPWHLFEVQVLQALIAQAAGELERAFDTLADVAAHAIPPGFRRIFLQDGAPVQRLIRQLIEAARPPAAPATWRSAARLLVEANLAPVAAVEVVTPPPTPPVSVQHLLSERELEILRLLAQNLSNKEIAYKLLLSPHTVRNHLVKVFDKLGANSRQEALLHARQIGLLPPRTL
jgi:LuxR family transcriptional regulator, maltose regulon positive regulatory protein